MARRYCLCLASFFLFLLPVSLKAAQIDWKHSLGEAVEAASKEGKFIVLDVSADWCPACRDLERHVYTDARFIEFSRSQIFMLVDADRESEGRRMQAQFRVEAFPTILVLDSRGHELDRLTGSTSPENLMESLQRIFDHPVPGAELDKQAEADPQDAELQTVAGRRAFDRRDFKTAERFLGRALQLADPADLQTVVPLLVDFAEAGFNNGHFETALSSIDRLFGLDESYRKIEWLRMRRALILSALDRNEEAYTAGLELMRSQSSDIREEARELIDGLPKEFRRTVEEQEKRHKRLDESLRKQKFDEAMPEVARILAEAPDDPLAHVQLARALFGLSAQKAPGPEAKRQLSRAYAELRLGRRLSVDDLGLYTTESELTEGFRDFRLVPRSSDARKEFEKAEKDFSVGRYQKAVERYRKVLREEPDFARAYLRLGDCFYVSGQMDTALSLYLQSSRKSPRDPAAYRSASDALLELGQSQRAREMLVESLLADPGYPLAWRGLETSAEREGTSIERHVGVVPARFLIPTDDGEPGSLLKTVPSSTVSSWRVYLNCKDQWRKAHADDAPCFLPSAREETVCLGLTLTVWDRLKSMDRSIQDADLDFLRQVWIDEQLDAFIFLELFTPEYRAAFETWKSKNRGRALRYLEDYVFTPAQAADRDGYNSSAMKAFNEGTKYHTSDPLVALELYRKALRQEPYMLPALQNATFLYFEQEEYDKALPYLTRWRELEPESSQALHLLAFVFIEHEEFADALPLLQKAAGIEQDPEEREKIESNIRFCQSMLEPTEEP